MATAGDVMTTDVLTAQRDEAVATVVQRMADRGVGAALVLSGNALAGIFTERDLLSRVIAAGKNPAATVVGDVATANPGTVSAGTHVRACAELLREKHYRHLPVVDGVAPVGIISARDFFEQVAGEYERFVDQRLYEDQLKGTVDPYDSLGGSYRA